MTDKPAPKRVRSRASKGEAEPLTLKIDSAEVQEMIDAEVRKIVNMAPSLTAADLTFERATLNADIDTIKANRKKAQDDVATCDAMLANYVGAVSILDRLIERLTAAETKAT